MAKLRYLLTIWISLVVIQGIVQASDRSARHDRSNNSRVNYIFDPKHLEELSAQAQAEVTALHLEEDPTQAFEFYNISEESSHEQVSVVEAYKTERVLQAYESLLQQSYPNKLLTDSKWIWNNVGGITARVKVLYCTSKEYLVLFGTQTPQEGFSGRYQSMDVWDVMLTGKMRSFSSEPTKAYPLLYGSTSVSYLPRGEARFYEMEAYTYMADYGRGSIWRAFWSGIIAPYLFVNHDYVSISRQIGDCVRSWWQHSW